MTALRLTPPPPDAPPSPDIPPVLSSRFTPDELLREFGVVVDVFIHTGGPGAGDVGWWAQKAGDPPQLLNAGTRRFHLEDPDGERMVGFEGGWPRAEHFFPSWRAAALAAIAAVQKERGL